MKKIFVSIIAAVMAFSLTACGKAGGSVQPTNTAEVEPAIESVNQTAKSVNAEPTEMPKETASPVETADAVIETAGTSDESESAGSDILVVYFSWSGNLDKMAHWVADETGGDLYRVTAKDPYPEIYNETADRAKSEQDKGIRPEINVDLTAEQMAGYNTVYFGFPVWWYDLPMSMWTFLESFDFSGKTIIPFFSHLGNSNGARALPTLTDLAKGATILSDKALSIRGDSVADSETAVRNWVKSLGQR